MDVARQVVVLVLIPRTRMFQQVLEYERCVEASWFMVMPTGIFELMHSIGEGNASAAI